MTPRLDELREVAAGAPPSRIRELRPGPVRDDAKYVLYWMLASRRARSNFALERAIAWASELGLPLVVFEPLRIDYPFASERTHRFVIEGMRDSARAFGASPVTYLPWVERAAGEGRGLLAKLAAHAAVVVTDDSPQPWLGGMVRAAAGAVPTRMEAVDHHGLLPLRATPGPFGYAHAFRRHLHRELPTHLRHWPRRRPLDDLVLPRLAQLPEEIASHRGFVRAEELEAIPRLVSSLRLDRRARAIDDSGGSDAAHARLEAFVAHELARYGERSHPDADVGSRLSSWLHFGHIGAHEVLEAVAARTGWTLERIAEKPTGKREGFWNLGDAEDAFFDELVTWRELGAVRCVHTTDFARYDGLPGWARATLEAHASDPRPALVPFDRLEHGSTDDPVWNAAQRQLLAEGRIHNYLRMYWGKRVIAWTRHPQQAFEWLVELNDRYAIDGRDPASWMNIGWVFGAYDRPWGPERPIYGTVRYMTAASAQRKLRMKGWLARYGDPTPQTSLF